MITSIVSSPFDRLRHYAVRLVCFFAIATLVVGCADIPSTTAATESPTAADSARIVSLDGTVTELLFELGYGEQVVGTDITSSYPAAAQEVPKLGHISQLNIEAVLELKPDLIFTVAAERPTVGLDKLRAAGIEVVTIETSPTLDNAVNIGRQLGEHLAVPGEKLEQLAARIERDRAALDQITAENDGAAAPRVLFLYARGMGRLLAAGTDTDAARMIELAGGQNAVTTFADFEALTPEALVAAAPDVILMFTTGLASLDGVEGLSQIPGMAETPAYRQERVIAMDGHYLTGFGVRAAQAATELARQLQPAEVL